MDTRKTKNYMSNREFFEEIVACQKAGKMSNRLGEMFTMLVTRYASKPNFSGYTYKDEMIATGVVACCAAFNKFEPARSATPNPFAFFTSVTHNSFLQILNKEKKQQNIRDRMLVDADLNPSFGYMESAKHTDSDDAHDGPPVGVAVPDIELENEEKPEDGEDDGDVVE